MEQINLVVAVAALVVAVTGLVSARAESLPLSKPLVALLAGIAAGPAGLHWLAPGDWPQAPTILKEAARFALAISVFGIALRTPRRDFRRLARPVGLLLGAGMIAMWLVSAGLAWAVLGLSPLLALLLGATVTPTDPVVASSIVTGGLAERSLPDRLRATLSLESGANDGLAYLIVMLPILLLVPPETGTPLGRWLVEVVLVGVLAAALMGFAAGWAAARALHHADAAGWVERHSLLGLSVALSLFVVTATRLAGSDGILAAFAAGAAFNLGIDRTEEFEEQNTQEAIGTLFNLPVFVLLGTMLPWQGWAALGWAGPAFAVAVLALRRPLAVLALRGVPGGGPGRRDAVFLGWFAPVGVAAIYYAILATERTGDAQLWHAASLCVAASILAHGVTSGPGLRHYRRAADGD